MRFERLACFGSEPAWILVSVALAAGALWMTVQRHQGFFVRCLPGSDFYVLAETPRVAGVALESDGRLTIELAGVAEAGWREHSAEGSSRVLNGASPTIQLRPGVEGSRLSGVSTGRVLDVRTQWAPGQPDPLVTFPSMPVSAAPRFSFSDFVLSPERHAPADVSAARALLEPLSLDSLESDRARVERLAAFLHEQLEPHRGSPTPRMARLNGLEQYREALAGRSEVYCANHAEIFAFMANVAGLPTRLVDVTGEWGSVAVGAHSFVETFVAEEERWIYVDLQLGVAGVRAPDGHMLAADELLDRIRRRTTADLTLRRLAAGAVEDVPWARRAGAMETFLNPAASLVYLRASLDRFAPLERLWRLVVRPQPAICEGAVPDRTGLRLWVTWLAVAGFGLWGGARLRHAIRGRRSDAGEGEGRPAS